MFKDLDNTYFTITENGELEYNPFKGWLREKARLDYVQLKRTVAYDAIPDAADEKSMIQVDEDIKSSFTQNKI